MANQTPIGYHYANHPAMSVDQVRNVVFTNFDISMFDLLVQLLYLLTIRQHRLDCLVMTTRVQWPLCCHSTCSDFTQVSISLDTCFCNPTDCVTVPGSSQLLVLSPFTPKYTVHNSYLNVSTTVTVEGFDSRSVQATIPKNAAAYVKSVSINGKATESRCHIDFYDVFKTGGNLTIEVTADKSSVDSCAGSLPDSLSTGGFSVAR